MLRTIRSRTWRDTTWDLRLWLEYVPKPRCYVIDLLSDLHQILEVCYKSDVKVVTVYAFSIENFKRSKREVDGLMAMAKIKLSQLMQHGEVLDRYNASIRILGQRDLIPKDVLEYCDRAVESTAHNKGYDFGLN